MSAGWSGIRGRSDGRRRARLAALALVLAAGGCAPRATGLPDSIALRWAKPQSLVEAGNAPADAIVIRWHDADSSDDEARYLAEQNCLAWDRNAVEVRAWTAGDTHGAAFVCRPLLATLAP
ncbi:MAG TPA: hypothetical protein VFA22_01115 [Stellaceae bacterium]|nr:hypothetical protein [Stellaceae bacterium]